MNKKFYKISDVVQNRQDFARFKRLKNIGLEHM